MGILEEFEIENISVINQLRIQENHIIIPEDRGQQWVSYNNLVCYKLGNIKLTVKFRDKLKEMQLYPRFKLLSGSCILN